MQFNRIFSMAALVMALSACTHLKGVVLEEPSQRPVRTAMLTVGRPNGISVFEQHAVNSNGEFDFQIMPVDENNVYIYDTAAGAELTARKIDRSEMNDHMKLHMRPLPRNNPGLPLDMGVNPTFN